MGEHQVDLLKGASAAFIGVHPWLNRIAPASGGGASGCDCAIQLLALDRLLAAPTEARLKLGLRRYLRPKRSMSLE